MPISPIASNLLLSATTQHIHAAAELIKAGKLVVLATETVYGIALNLLDPEARAGALKIKGAVPGQMSSPWVVHVARVEDVFGWAPTLSPLAHRLISRALPGPVAFQVKLAGGDLEAARKRLGEAADQTLQDGFLTIRCPDFGTTQQVLLEATGEKGAVAIIGAGTPSIPGVFEVSDVPEALLNGEAKSATKGAIAAVLDGGPVRYRRPSTLVRIVGDSFSVVRAGVIDERIIQKMADFQILFICSGNTCRSPMAAGLAARLLADRLGISPGELPLRHIVVQSAGLHANRGMRAAPEAVEAVAPLRADLSAHISQVATNDLLRRADVIYTMTEAHREEIVDRIPAAAAKTHRLDPDEDVEDPIGAGQAVYTHVAGRLAELVKERVSELVV